MPLPMQQMSGQNLNYGYTHVGIPTISNLPQYITRGVLLNESTFQINPMQQMSGQKSTNGYMHGHIPTMSITSDVLDILRYESSIK